MHENKLTPPFAYFFIKYLFFLNYGFSQGSHRFKKNLFCKRRSVSTATRFSLQKVNFESASNDCNDMFWCISITNNVKSCKKTQ